MNAACAASSRAANICGSTVRRSWQGPAHKVPARPIRSSAAIGGPRCRRSVGSLWGRRPLDNLELRLFRSAAGKPASDRAHLTVFQWLPMVLFGGLILCQACAARGCQRWGHQCWCRHQRQERQTCQEGSHRYPQPLRQSAHSARAAPWIYRLVPPAEPMPPLPLTHLGMESSEPTPECQRLTLCLCKELGREKRQGRVPFKPWA